MLRAFRNSLLALLILLVGYVLFVAAMRLRAPTLEQQAALDVLARAEPALPPGKDAFAFYWFGSYDVPPAAWSSLLAEDVRRFQQVAYGERAASFVSVAKARYPERPATPTTEGGLCGALESCLVTVRRDSAQSRELVARHAGTLALEPLQRSFAGLHYPFEPSVLSPIADFARFHRLLRTQYALQFLAGERESAFAGICRDLSVQRRLGRHTDNLIFALVSAGNVGADVELLADMLAESPPDQPLPDSCELALQAPEPDEASVCPAMHGEFSFFANSIKHLTSLSEDNKSSLSDRILLTWMDRDQVVAMVARRYAATCGEDARVAAARGSRWRVPQEQDCTHLEYAANPMGCMMADVNLSYGMDYQDRRVDMVAKIQVLRGLLWLRKNRVDGQGLATQWAARPAALHSAGNRERLSKDGRRIELPLLRLRGDQDDVWSLPLTAQDAGRTLR